MTVALSRREEIRQQWLLFNREIQRILADHQIMAIGMDSGDLLAIHRQQNKQLSELCFHHKRALDFVAGEKVEPIAQEASATLVAKFDIAG